MSMSQLDEGNLLLTHRQLKIPYLKEKKTEGNWQAHSGNGSVYFKACHLLSIMQRPGNRAASTAVLIVGLWAPRSRDPKQSKTSGSLSCSAPVIKMPQLKGDIPNL